MFIAALGSLMATTTFATQQEKVDVGVSSSTEVRPLTFESAPADFLSRFGGQNKLTSIEDIATAENLFGKEAAKQLVKSVDFTKEKIVLLSWKIIGPPRGTPFHAIKSEGKSQQILFWVNDRPGGRMPIWEAEFFIVPKNAAVSFEIR